MEPAITIRFQLGQQDDVTEAADWVEYCNGNTSTKWGALRAARGYPEPYNVQYWYLGNEIAFQARYPNYPANMNSMHPPSASEYTAMLGRVIPPMKAASPTIALRLFAVAYQAEWNAEWLAAVGDDIYATSLHDGYFNQPAGETWSEEAVTACAKRPTAGFVPALATLRKQLDASNHTVMISADEWGLGPPWIVPSFGTPHAMYAAGFLGMAARTSAAYKMAFTNYFEPINEGAVHVLPFTATLTPVGQVMGLYSAHTGGAVVSVDGASGGDLDVVATLHTDGSAVVTVANLNAVGWFSYEVKLGLANTAAFTKAYTTTLLSNGISMLSTFNTTTATISVDGSNVSLSAPPFSVVHAVFC